MYKPLMYLLSIVMVALMTFGCSSSDAKGSINDVSPGYVLFSTYLSNDTYLIDSNATRVKTWTSVYPAAGSSYLTEKKTLLRLGITEDAKKGSFSRGVGGALEEFNSDGEVIWSIILDDDSYTLHHDFKQIDDNTIIALSWELRAYDGNYYWNERIIKIDKVSSSIIWEWSAMDDSTILPTQNSIDDYIHFNSIDYLNGKILVSSRELNTIYEIDEDSKAVTSVYTAGNTLQLQHDASYLENGNILVFNNGESNSKILELDIDDNIVWKYSDGFYSKFMSGAQRLDNGNTLICVAGDGIFIEVNQQKQKVWEYENDNNVTINGEDSNRVFKVRKYLVEL